MIPPRILVAIVIPTLAMAPACCPSEYAREFAKPFAAATTSGAVNISLMFFFMPSTAFVMPLRSTSPSPALNPSLKSCCNSFSLSMSFSSAGFRVSSVSFAASTMFSLRPPPAAPPPDPDPPLPESSFFVREWISSNDARPAYSFAAFLAEDPALSVAPPRFSMEPVAVSAAPPIPSTAVVVVFVFFPVIFAIMLLNASVTVRILLSSALSTLITGVNTAMSPLPIVAFRALNLSVSTLTWLAHPSDVLAKSP